MSPTAPQKMIVAPPEDATPSPIPAALSDRLDALPVGDPDTYWVVCRLVEFAYRLGYADGHARGYRDRDREVVAERGRPGVENTQAVRALKSQP